MSSAKIRTAELRPCAAAVALALAAALACSSSSSEVTRIVRGQEHRGRYIPSEAYAAYGRGAYLESHGQLRAAAAAYAQALEYDPDSVELWTRIGELRCRLDEPSRALAFARALELDPSYEPLWRSQARCALDHGQLGPALQYAQKALALDPNREQTSVLLALVHERRGELAHAARYLEALSVRSPDSVTAQRALLDFARRTRNAALRERAELSLRRLALAATAELRAGPETLHALDRALRRGELDAARRLAIDARVSGGLLAARAAALGSVELARTQAESVLDLDPSDGDAWAAALVASDLLGDHAAFRDVLRRLSKHRVALAPLSVRLISEVLGRRVGSEAAAAWLRAWGPLPAPADPLERSVQERLASEDVPAGGSPAH